MRPVLALLIVSALSVNAYVRVSAQSAPQTQFDPNQNEQSVIVEGCLNGKRFRPDMTLATMRLLFQELGVSELRLEGQPGLIKAIEKEHRWHQDQISGIVVLPTDRDVRARSARVGKRTTVTTTQSADRDPRTSSGVGHPSVGKGDTASNTLPNQSWARMKVTSLKHVYDTCPTPEPALIRR